MAIHTLDHFYDRQQLRFLEQVVRAFSGFQYTIGSRKGMPPELKMVPVTMAKTSKLVANIMRNGSENSLNSAPQITVWQTGLTGRREDVQNPAHVDELKVIERAIDPLTNKYTAERGRSYSVKRLMPRPFNMEIQIDLWTSNYEQKYEIMEQILPVMYPNFWIQNSDNALDWTALTDAHLEDITWTSRSIPVGTEELEISTMKLRIPIWISPPAMVTQQRLIEQIVTNINDVPFDENTIVDKDYAKGKRMSQEVVTPGNFKVYIEGNIASLVDERGSNVDAEGNPYKWSELLWDYGALRPAVSRMILNPNAADLEATSGIVGTLQYSQDPNELFFQIDPDTIPSNTFAPVDALIDPMTAFPSQKLPPVAQGQRYLIISDVGPSVAWGNLNASVNDIIEFSGTEWFVSFDASQSDATQLQFVLNLNSSNQLKWTGIEWILSIDGIYNPGFWRLKL
jgi:hypothetical protein